MNSEMIKTAVQICILTGFIFGGIIHFAPASELKLVEMRLEQKIVGDQIIQMQERMYKIKDRHGGQPCDTWTDQNDKDEYRKLEQQIEQSKKRYDKLLN